MVTAPDLLHPFADARPHAGKTRSGPGRDLGNAIGDPDHADIHLRDGQARRPYLRQQSCSRRFEGKLDGRAAPSLIGIHPAKQRAEAGFLCTSGS